MTFYFNANTLLTLFAKIYNILIIIINYIQLKKYLKNIYENEILLYI